MSPRSTVMQNMQIGTAVFSFTIVIVCVASSVMFIVIGYACGWFGHKHKQSHASKKTSCHNEEHKKTQTLGPLYKELHQESTLKHQDLVELSENVAYGPIAK